MFSFETEVRILIEESDGKIRSDLNNTYVHLFIESSENERVNTARGVSNRNMKYISRSRVNSAQAEDNQTGGRQICGDFQVHAEPRVNLKYYLLGKLLSVIASFRRAGSRKHEFLMLYLSWFRKDEGTSKERNL